MNNKKKSIFIGLGIFLILMGGFYIFKSMQYQNQFLPKTTADGVSIGNKSVEEANKALQKHYQERTFTAVEDDKELFSFTGTDIGVATDFTKTLKEQLNKQQAWSWPINQFSSRDKQVALEGVSLNQEEVKKFISTLSLDQEERKLPVNATIKKTEKDFTIQPEVKGNSFDLDKVAALIMDSVQEDTTKINMKEAYAVPTVLADDETLRANLSKLKQLSDLSIVYQIYGSEEIVPRETLMSWLNVDKTGDVIVDKEGITTYMQGLSDKYSTYEKARDFKTSKRGVIKVPAGTYGWTLDVARETEALANDILLGEDIERTPRYNGSGYADDGNEFGKSYVEVDLEAQHMWFYKDGKIAKETDIISGKPATPTPKGIYYVWKKERNATLTGEDYATPVDHWLPIDWSGVGIHDSPWQTVYGGNTHLTKGSHGCINTPPGVMVEIYNQIETGTPVIVY